jgi:hypothetical protein
VNSDRRNKSVQNLKKISELLDTKYSGPFGIKFGLDPILGLIPGIGDLVTTVLSFYIIFQAYVIGVGSSVLIRMCVNVLLENLFDMIPFFGNFFDLIWKSNTKNLELLNKYIQSPVEQRLISRFFVAFIFLFFSSVLIYTFYLSLLLLKALVSFLHF